jgi:hypothetical protein
VTFNDRKKEAGWEYNTNNQQQQDMLRYHLHHHRWLSVFGNE